MNNFSPLCPYLGDSRMKLSLQLGCWIVAVVTKVMIFLSNIRSIDSSFCFENITQQYNEKQEGVRQSCLKHAVLLL